MGVRVALVVAPEAVAVAWVVVVKGVAWVVKGVGLEGVQVA